MAAADLAALTGTRPAAVLAGSGGLAATGSGPSDTALAAGVAVMAGSGTVLVRARRSRRAVRGAACQTRLGCPAAADRVADGCPRRQQGRTGQVRTGCTYPNSLASVRSRTSAVTFIGVPCAVHRCRPSRRARSR